MTEDVLSEMRRTSRGWRCQLCFLDGLFVQTRKDDTPLSEADRCPGCGETVCDRHYQLPEQAQQKRHDVRAHASQL